MAIFSNLDGTMKESFILGKKGALLTYDKSGNDLKVQTRDASAYLPISAGDPTRPEHLVTLEYYSNTLGASPILTGSTIPDSSFGQNGNLYVQVDSTNILQIFFKDQGVWKTFA